MQLTDIEEKRVKNTIRYMAKILSFGFGGKSNLYIGFYAFLTAQMFLNRYFDEDCNDEIEFKNVKRCLLKNLSEFTKTMYAKNFKGGK